MGVDAVHLVLFCHGSGVHVGQEISGATNDHGVRNQGYGEADAGKEIFRSILRLCGNDSGGTKGRRMKLCHQRGQYISPPEEEGS